MIPYKLEIYIYWSLLFSLLLCFFIIGIKNTKSALQSFIKSSQNSFIKEIGNYSSERDQLIDIAGISLFVLSVFALTWAITFPTPLSVPTVRITASGDVIPLPYGDWSWITPEGVGITRLENTLDTCYIDLKGRTQDGVFFNAGTLPMRFKITDFTTFYKHYPKRGKYGFCDDVNAVVFHEVFDGIVMYPNTEAPIATVDQKERPLEQRVITVLRNTFRAKGIVPITE